jgi:hypothetical protein
MHSQFTAVQLNITFMPFRFNAAVALSKKTSFKQQLFVVVSFANTHAWLVNLQSEAALQYVLVGPLTVGK